LPPLRRYGTYGKGAQACDTQNFYCFQDPEKNKLSGKIDTKYRPEG
jgi:hypothetical protein